MLVDAVGITFSIHTSLDLLRLISGCLFIIHYPLAGGQNRFLALLVGMQLLSAIFCRCLSQGKEQFPKCSDHNSSLLQCGQGHYFRWFSEDWLETPAPETGLCSSDSHAHPCRGPIRAEILSWWWSRLPYHLQAAVFWFSGKQPKFLADKVSWQGQNFCGKIAFQYQIKLHRASLRGT